MFKKIAIISTITLFAVGCASRSTLPPPKSEMQSSGIASTKNESLDNATEHATETCKHWNAVPLITRTETRGEAEKSEGIFDGIKRNIKQFATGEGSNEDAFTTTLFYTCAQ